MAEMMMSQTIVDPATQALRDRQKAARLRAKAKRESDPEAMARYKAQVKKSNTRKRVTPEYIEAANAKQWARRKATPISARDLYNAHRLQAKYRSIPFSLTLEDVEWLFVLTPLCSLSGVRLSYSLCDPHKVSIDRIDSTRGYTVDNVQLVSAMVNLMKQKFDEVDFVAICKQIANYQATP